MAETLLKPGDEIDVLVRHAKPFGLLVENETGKTGVVRGARAEAGATLRVRVLVYDAVESRFSAALAE